jgi:hypothetical protein
MTALIDTFGSFLSEGLVGGVMQVIDLIMNFFANILEL